MTSTLETARQLHSDIEVLEVCGGKLMAAKANKALSVSLDQCLAFVTHQVHTKAQELEEYILDGSELHKSEIASIAGNGTFDVWHSFYGRVKRIKEYHALNSERPTSVIGIGDEAWMNEAYSYAARQGSLFTSAEGAGRFLDMNCLHMAYINLRRIREHRVNIYLQEQWRRHCKASGDSQLSLVEFSKRKDVQYVDPDYIVWLKDIASFEGIPRYLKYKQQDYEV